MAQEYKQEDAETGKWPHTGIPRKTYSSLPGSSLYSATQRPSTKLQIVSLTKTSLSII